MFTDKQGNSFNVTLEPHGEAAAVVIRHPKYADGQPIAVTGVRQEAGAFESLKAWTSHLSGDNPPASLTGLDGQVAERAP